MKKIILLVCFGLIKTGLLFGQANYEQFMAYQTVPLIGAKDILDISINWKLKGNLEAFLNEGINDLREGNWSGALKNFNEIIEEDSSAWIGYYFRGITLKNLRQFPKSEIDFIVVQQLAPTLAEGFYGKGQLYQEYRDFTRARKEYRKALSLKPNFVYARYNLGAMALMEGDTEGALNQYEKCTEIDDRFGPAYMAQGILKLISKKDRSESIGWFDKALAMDSTLSATYFWRGFAYSILKQNEKCLPDWNMAVRYDPTNPFLLMMRGFLLIQLEKYDLAFSDLRKVMVVNNNSPTLVEGVMLEKQNDVRALVKYLAVNGYGLPEERFSLLKKSFCLFLVKKYLPALENIESDKQGENNAITFFMKGMIYDGLGKTDSAYVYFDRTLALDNEIFEVHKKRGFYLASKNDMKAAEIDFAEMIRIEPDSKVSDPKSFITRAHIRFNQLDYIGALLDVTEYLKVYPTDMEAYFLRARSRIQTGDYEGANQDLKVFISHVPNYIKVLIILGDNSIRVNDLDCALTSYQKCANMAATDPTGKKYPLVGYNSQHYYDMHFALANVYILRKNWELADAQLDTVRKASTNLNKDVRTQMHFVRGKLEFAKTSYSKAIDEFETVAEADPENFEAKYLMAKACQAAGQKLRAMTLFRQINGYLDSGDLYQSLAKKK